MLSNLKVKTNGTSSSTLVARTISKNEIVSDENTDSDIVSSVSTKMVFDDDLPKIKRFVGNSKPMSFTKTGIPNLLLLICNLKKDLSSNTVFCFCW